MFECDLLTPKLQSDRPLREALRTITNWSKQDIIPSVFRHAMSLKKPQFSDMTMNISQS